jgi:outer membrane protein TolC
MAVNEQVVKLNEAKRLPTAAFVTDLGFQGEGFRIWDEQAFAFANISLSWDIFTGFQNQAKVQQAKIDQDILSTQYLQLQQQIQLQIKQAYFELKSSQEQVKTAKSALTNAKEGYRLIKKQYENGTTFFFQVVQTQTNMVNAELAVSIAEFDVLVKQAQLDFASGK